MKRQLSITLAVAILSCICAVQCSAKESWVRIQSKNFTLIGNASESEMRKVATKLEGFRQTLSLIFPQVKIETPVPTTVVIFKTHDGFRPFKPRYHGKVNDDVAGYFLAGPYMNYIAITAEDRGLSPYPYEVIFHEYEHFITGNNLLRVPVWLDEGLAEFYSSFATSDDDQKITLGLPLGRHILYLKNRPLIPLKTLLAVDRKSPYYSEGSKAGVFYAESWALVHYLMLANQEKRKGQLLRFINLLDSDLPIEEMFRQAFQTDYKTIEEELRSYIHKFAFPVLEGTFKQPVNFEKEVKSTPLSEAEVHYYLGDLLLNLRRPDEAEARLQKSISLDARFAPSVVSLGILKMNDDTDQAKKLFQSAIEIDSKNYLAHYYLALALVREKLVEEAINSFKQSISLKADVAPVYMSLGYAYRQNGQENEAIETFRQGLRVNPKEAYFYHALGYIFWQRGQGQFAANDAVSYLRIKGWRDEHSQYMVLMKYFGLRQAGRAADAARVLEEAAGKVDTSSWPFPVIRYLQRALTIQDLLALATDNDKLTEVHAYSGLELSLNGERAAALEHLRWVKENGNKKFVEYPLALAELERIAAAAGSQ